MMYCITAVYCIEASKAVRIIKGIWVYDDTAVLYSPLALVL